MADKNNKSPTKSSSSSSSSVIQPRGQDGKQANAIGAVIIEEEPDTSIPLRSKTVDEAIIAEAETVTSEDSDHSVGVHGTPPKKTKDQSTSSSAKKKIIVPERVRAALGESQSVASSSRHSVSTTFSQSSVKQKRELKPILPAGKGRTDRPMTNFTSELREEKNAQCAKYIFSKFVAFFCWASVGIFLMQEAIRIWNENIGETRSIFLYVEVKFAVLFLWSMLPFMLIRPLLHSVIRAKNLTSFNVASFVAFALIVTFPSLYWASERMQGYFHDKNSFQSLVFSPGANWDAGNVFKVELYCFAIAYMALNDVFMLFLIPATWFDLVQGMLEPETVACLKLRNGYDVENFYHDYFSIEKKDDIVGCRLVRTVVLRFDHGRLDGKLMIDELNKRMKKLEVDPECPPEPDDGCCVMNSVPTFDVDLLKKKYPDFSVFVLSLAFFTKCDFAIAKKDRLRQIFVASTRLCDDGWGNRLRNLEVICYRKDTFLTLCKKFDKRIKEHKKTMEWVKCGGWRRLWQTSHEIRQFLFHIFNADSYYNDWCFFTTNTDGIDGWAPSQVFDEPPMRFIVRDPRHHSAEKKMTRVGLGRSETHFTQKCLDKIMEACLKKASVSVANDDEKRAEEQDPLLTKAITAPPATHRYNFGGETIKGG